MKELPILYSGSMVRAILRDCKTQTRRVIKPQPELSYIVACDEPGVFGDEEGDVQFRCPYGQPGARLWVRETWAVQRFEPCEPHERDWQELHSPVIRYLADGATRKVQGDRTTGVGIYRGPVEKTRVSIHMPRWASRILLEVTDVRVQRVQDISEEDALAEGVPFSAALMPGGYRGAFHGLWDSINAKRGFGWDANPWVWALTFKRVESRNV